MALLDRLVDVPTDVDVPTGSQVDGPNDVDDPTARLVDVPTNVDVPTDVDGLTDSLVDGYMISIFPEIASHQEDMNAFMYRCLSSKHSEITFVLTSY